MLCGLTVQSRAKIASTSRRPRVEVSFVSLFVGFWLLLQRGMLGEERVDRFLRIDYLLHQRECAGRL